MCGIAGVIHISGSKSEFGSIIQNMQSTLLHRGPDGEGKYIDPHFPVALAHRRLAIIDPKHGKQPMTSHDGVFTIVFNGAIYNYLELRQTLIQLGHPIQSHSDTEVLLYAYQEWQEKCLDHLIGMFAFVIWDRNNQTLFCARDRIGIKPFYYYFSEGLFIFASEIKAILASKLIQAEPNLQGLQDYTTFQFCLGEKTLFKSIIKLEPGHYLTIVLKDKTLKLAKQQYWEVNYQQNTFYSENEYVEQLKALLEDSVKYHLRSDVPLGAHLSGGLDSSTLVSLASKHLPHPLKTFTGAFNLGSQYDETPYAKLMASSAGSEYHEQYIEESAFSDILPKLIYIMDEPVAGPGLIPQYFVSQLAAKHVKVILGGQGGDEIFIGYVRYLIAALEQSLYQAIYRPSSSQDAISLGELSHHLEVLKDYKPLLQKFWQSNLFAPPAQRYYSLINRQELNQTDYSSYEAFKQVFLSANSSSPINQMLHFDLKASLPALLHVEDRTSMAASLESRVPLLDHRIVEFMALIPPHIKFSGGQLKYLFKKAIKHTLPSPILERKDKIGFNTPITQWAKGSGKEFVNDLLHSQRAKERGIFNLQKIQDRTIWGTVCLELWYQQFIDVKAVEHV